MGRRMLAIGSGATAAERTHSKMAKVINPLLSGSASGQFGGQMTFDKRGYVRKYVIPANPQSAGQMAVRGKLGDIQRELKLLGTTLRAELKSALGYRWNSLIVSELMANNSAKWDAQVAIYNAFAAGDKTAWATADTAVGLVNTDGLVFYLVAKALYDVALRVHGDGLIPAPVGTNSAAVASDWTA